MKTVGLVLEASLLPLGNEVDGTHAIGTQVLQLYDVADFAESGGEVKINGIVYGYESVDDDESTMTLNVPLGIEIPDESRVDAHPPADQLIALVQIDEEDDPVEAPVNEALKDFLPEGVRDEDAQENVIVENDGNDWQVIDIPASALLRDASYSYIPAGTVQRVEGSLEMVDAISGVLRQRVGQHDSGVYTTSDYNAPPQPMPDGMSFAPANNAVKVVWSGSAVSLILEDFNRLAIYMDTTSGYTPTEANEVSQITSLNGGIVMIPATAGTTQYMRAAIVNTSGVPSEYTPEVAVTPSAVDVGDAGIDTYIQDDKPATGTEGDVWWESDNSNRQYRYSEAAADYLPVDIGKDAVDFSLLGGILGNLIRDPLFNDPDLRTRRLNGEFRGTAIQTGDWSFVTVVDAIPNRQFATVMDDGIVAHVEVPLATKDVSPANNMFMQDDIPVIPGQVLYYGAMARVLSGAGEAKCVLYGYDNSGAIKIVTTMTPTPLTVSDGWVLFGYQNDLPNTVVSAKMSISFDSTVNSTIAEFYEPIVAHAGWWGSSGRHKYTFSPGTFEFQTPTSEFIAYAKTGYIATSTFDENNLDGPNGGLETEFSASGAGMWLRRENPVTGDTKVMMSPQQDGNFITGWYPSVAGAEQEPASTIYTGENGFVRMTSYNPNGTKRSEIATDVNGIAYIQVYDANGNEMSSMEMSVNELTAWIGGNTAAHCRLDIDATRTVLWGPLPESGQKSLSMDNNGFDLQGYDEVASNLPATGAYAGYITLIKRGSMVFSYGNIGRATGDGGGAFVNTGVVFPVKYRPANTQSLSAKPFFNSTLSYRYKINTDGTLQVQMSGANSQNMTFNEQWYV